MDALALEVPAFHRTSAIKARPPSKGENSGPTPQPNVRKCCLLPFTVFSEAVFENY